MKKLLILSLVGILFLTGCQPTPEKEVVAQKDLEQMLSTADKHGAQSTGLSLIEQYGIPETFQCDLKGTNGILSINAAAAITVPEGDRMPIYRVKATNFTQEQVTAFWKELVGDTEMWHSPNQRTKAMIQQEILSLKQQMAAEDLMFSPEDAQEELKRLEEDYSAAPETMEEHRAEGTLETTPVYENGTPTSKELASYTGFNAYEKTGSADTSGKTFTVQNNYDLKESALGKEAQGQAQSALPISRNAYIWYRNSHNLGASTVFNDATALPVDKETQLDPNIASTVGPTPKEAIEKAQALLDKTDSGMMVHHAYLMSGRQRGEVDGSGEAAQRYAYKLFCVRLVNGVPASYINSTSTTGDFSGSENGTVLLEEFSNSASWGYEAMTISINKEGIFEVHWNSPLEVTETVNEDSQLLPFSDVQGIYEKMMSVTYDVKDAYQSMPYSDMPNAADNISGFSYNAGDDIVPGVAFEVDRVTLSLHRIAEQNSFENGLLIPAWNFYGKKTETFSDGYSQSVVSNSMMTINAIDGTVIDILKGY
jgi:hypothetical protein